MKNVDFTGRIKVYLSIPLVMIIPLVIVAIVLGVVNGAYFLPSLTVTVVYALLALFFYFYLRQRIARTIVGFAVGLESSQKKFLEEMPVPYAVIDSMGDVYWYNARFGELTKGSDLKITSVSSIFSEITGEVLKSVEDTNVSIRVAYDDRIYNANIERLSQDESGEGNTQSLFALMFLDETQTELYKQRLEDYRLVVGNVYIDNYEEVLNSVDDVKRSLLEAVIERRIRKYFSEADAIVRKTDKDKFFVVFPNRYLDKLIENKFSILEDIKNTKVGNEIDVTLSIGLGLNGDSYTRDAEYAKSSTSLALGRGGSQVVVKNGGDVSIFGAKGREVEKNTRVKARVKAQALREIMANRERIIVMGHRLPDFDSLGACIAIYCMARELNKPCSIIMNSVNSSMRPMIETFTENDDYPEDLFIDSSTAIDEAQNSNCLVVVVDTNIPEMTECPELLEMTSNIVVFDHHRQGKTTIRNPILSYVETYASSTSEMVAELGQYFTEGFRLHPVEADCIYTGILIDTNNFMSKTGVRTFEAAAYLRRSGADVMRVRKLLREDIVSYKKRAEIVRDAKVYRDAFAISICNPEGVESPTVLGAQAANELLNILGIKASFVLTPMGDRVYLSSRSIDEIDVQLIMEQFGGGGHLNIAGAQIENSSVDQIIQRIKQMLDQLLDEGEIK